MGGHLVGVHFHQGTEVLVGHRAVAAFEEVVDDCLPVGLDPVGQPVREGEALEIRRVGQHLLGQVSRLFGQWRGLRIEIDEDERTKLLYLHRHEAEVGLVEDFDLIRAARGAQPAVEAVGPGMIGAGDDSRAPFALQQFVAPMPADVVEGAQIPLGVAHREHALALDVRGQIAARLAQFLHMAEELPGAVEDRPAIQLEEPRLAITGRVEGIGPLRYRIVA